MATGRKIISFVFGVMLVLGLPNNIGASTGGDDPVDFIFSRYAPDIDLELYQAGNLGVLQAGYPRIFLYPAWRAIMLGSDELKKSLPTPGSLSRFCCDKKSGWRDESDLTQPKMQWATQRALITAEPPEARLNGRVYDEKDPYRYYYSDCTDESYRFAGKNLAQLRLRKDATSARLRDWVAAQDIVYQFCGHHVIKGQGLNSSDEGARVKEPALILPIGLPETESVVWRQHREYQIAAAVFYSGDNARAMELFQAIGNQSDHPLQKWGAYLALRAKIREVYWKNMREPVDHYVDREYEKKMNDGVVILKDDLDEESIKVVADMLEKIVLDVNLSEVHELARASFRAFIYRVTPHRRFHALSTRLSEYQRDPSEEDTLGDWRRLANYFVDDQYQYGEEAAALDQGDKNPITKMREEFEFFDWIRSIQSCAIGGSANASAVCKAASVHARGRWKKAVSEKRMRESRTWLVAAMMTTNNLDKDLEKAAEKVVSTAPEYLSIRYNLARLLRLSGNSEKARILLDLELGKSFKSASALNLLMQERFASAHSLEDAGQYLFRAHNGNLNPDTKEIVFSSLQKDSVEDARYWIENGLSIKDLLTLSGVKSLSMNLRVQLSVMAWVRADLVGKDTLANQAASVVIQYSPEMKALVERYLQAGTKLLRRHALVLAAVKRGASTHLNGEPMFGQFVNGSTAYRNLSACCGVAGENGAKELDQVPGEWPASPQVSGEPGIRNLELEALRKLHIDNVFLARHLLEYAAKYSDDEAIPELLSSVIRSNKYSGMCSEDQPQCKDAFKACFNLLHKKYGKTAWAKQTRHWY